MIEQVHTSTEWRSTPYISSHFTLSRNLYSAWPGLIPLENNKYCRYQKNPKYHDKLTGNTCGKRRKKDKVQCPREIQGQIVRTQFICPLPEYIVYIVYSKWSWVKMMMAIGRSGSEIFYKFYLSHQILGV